MSDAYQACVTSPRAVDSVVNSGATVATSLSPTSDRVVVSTVLSLLTLVNNRITIVPSVRATGPVEPGSVRHV